MLIMYTDERLTRRRALAHSEGRQRSVIVAGKVVVNLDSKTVEVAGSRVHLTRREYQVLELLSLRMGASVTKEAFIHYLYGGINEPKPKIIDVFVCKIRKKLAAAGGGGKCIETIWARGYLLRDRIIGGRQPGMEFQRSRYP